MITVEIAVILQKARVDAQRTSSDSTSTQMANANEFDSNEFRMVSVVQFVQSNRIDFLFQNPVIECNEIRKWIQRNDDNLSLSASAPLAHKF